MDLATIFRSGDVFVGLTCTNKNKALQLVCEKASQSLGMEGDKLVDVIRKREDLGSTGIGGGIAVPHAAVSNVEGLRGFIFRTAKPLDFEAIDGAPVDLIFLLVFDEKRRTEYLKVLASIARKANSEGTLSELRSAESPEALYSLFVAADEVSISRTKPAG
jgi:PTS system nitrogen regulatory IIA component